MFVVQFRANVTGHRQKVPWGSTPRARNSGDRGFVLPDAPMRCHAIKVSYPSGRRNVIPVPESRINNYTGSMGFPTFPVGGPVEFVRN